MNEALEKCPFCGCIARTDFIVPFDFPKEKHWFCICDCCGARMSYSKDKSSAIKRWNRRAK
ncbi:MAG: Lar family restriction alleviation protein [Schwartzia sp.]|nr:Lar family restriction alleviation protein [Schwartzia sp. (in: firmicutes)]